MATKTIAWSSGTGNITLTYGGQGNGTITVQSDDNNLFEQRSQTITVQTTAGSPQQTKTVTIVQAARQQIDLSTAVVTAANQTYSGSALTPVPTVTLNGETIPSTGYDVTYSNNTNAGTATITITGKGDYTGTANGSFTINKAAPTYTAPTAKSLTYNRGSQALLNAGSTSHGTIQYSSNGSSWSTTIPSQTNAGSYTVYWRLVGDSNHNDVGSTSINVTIAKVTPVVATAPSARTGLTYTGSNQNLLSGGSMKHSSSDTTAVAGTFTYAQGKNAGTYSSLTWSFAPTDSTNYNSTSGTVSGSVSIAKANPTYVAPIANNRTYNTSSAALLNAGSSTTAGSFTYCATQSGTYTTTIPTQTNAGTYTTYWKFTPTDTTNYNSIGATAVSTTISAKTVSSPTITLSQSTYTYSGSACTPTATVKDGSTTISSSEYTVYYSNNTNAGTATVTITDKSGGNYTVSGSTTFTINKANGVAGVSARSLTYSGSAQNLVTVSGNTGTVHYRLGTSGSWTTTIPTSTNANDYTVYYYVDSSTNYNAVGSSSSPYSVTTTIAKAAPTYTAPVASSNLKYTGSAQYLTTTGSTSHGTIYYSSDGSTWYTTRRTGTAVNTYTTYWKLTGDSNHSDVASTSITTTIAKGTGSVTTAPTAKNISYTGSAQTVANAGSGTGTMYYRLGTSGSYSTTVPKATNPGDYTLYYYAAASTNYEQSSTSSISITMKESYSTNYGYVSSGLVFALDGVSKGHDSTKWLDLVGGLEFPFENVTKGTNKVTFNGSGIMKCTASKSFPSSSCTIEVICKTATDTLGGIVFMPGVSNNVIGYIGNKNVNTKDNNSKVYFTYPEFDRIFSCNDNVVFINGRKIIGYDTNSWTVNSGFISLGGRSASDSYRWSGDLYGIRIYNRKLSESEILQNQGIDNTRFGFDINIAQDYVSNGLVFQLDGINKGSDSNNWTDLIGGLKFPYGSNATKGTNYVQFSGTGSIQCTASKSFSQTSCTIEVVADRPPSANSVIFYPAVKGEIAFIYMGIANQTLIEQGLMTIEWGTNTAASWRVRRSDMMVSVNADRGAGNTKLGTAGGNDSWGAQIDGKYKIGGRNTDYFYTGKIYAIRIYNRKLSHAEIVQNQRLDNIRFGLGAKFNG